MDQERVTSEDIHVDAKKRRRGSFFKVGGLAKKTKAISYKVQSQVRSRMKDRRVCPKAAPEVEVEVEKLYCEFCKLEFPTKFKKDTHMKYSALHELNMKSKIAKPKETPAKAKEILNLIYRGCKFIVKQNVQLDLYIYEQPITAERPYKRLAVICYNIDKEEEYPPIYLNAELVELHCQEGKSASEPNLSKEVNVVTEVVDGCQKYKTEVGNFVMSRISYSGHGGIVIEKNSKDTFETLLVPGPRRLDGANIEHKRRGSLAEQFEKAERRLEAEQRKLYEASKEAMDLANKTRISMNTFDSTFHKPTAPVPVPERVQSSKLELLGQSIVSPIWRIGSKILHAVTSPRSVVKHPSPQKEVTSTV